MRHHLKIAFFFLLLAAAVSCKRYAAIEDIPYDPVYNYASNACPYHSTDRTDTPAPSGYKPFYMSHYGRHGSRFLTGSSDVDLIVKSLEEQKQKGNLTALGNELLDSIKSQAAYSEGRYGQLSTLGAREHYDIASRMYQRFPQIWRRNGKIRAVASYFGQRCIISMAHAALALKSYEPTLQFEMLTGDAGYREIVGGGVDSSIKKICRDSLQACFAKNFSDGKLVADWFVNPDEDLDVYELGYVLYSVWKVNGCMDRQFIDILHYMSEEDLAKINELASNFLYSYNGATREFGQKRLAPAKTVLKTIMSQADDAISGESGLCANLRYSHDTASIPLYCTMGIEGFDSEPSFSETWKTWQCQDMIPMGANMQMVFFRKRNCGKILVKFLLNEKEVRIPAIESVTGPYYDWQDVKTYWESRI